MITRGYAVDRIIIRGFGTSDEGWYEIINLISSIAKELNLESKIP